MVHIVYRTSEQEYVCTGKNYTTLDPIKAIEMWKEEFPSALFIAAKLIEK